MTEIAMAERQAPLQVAFDQIYEACQWQGGCRTLNEANVVRLDYAFFTRQYPDIPEAMQIGQSVSYVDGLTQARTTNINVCWAEDGTGVGSVDPHDGNRPYSIIRLIDHSDFVADQLKPTGTYIARSNEDQNADLIMFDIEGQGHQMQLRRLSDEEQFDLAAKLQTVEIAA